MKKSTKATVLSAFVFPGAGLLWLQQYKYGLVFVAPGILITIYIFRETLSIANTLSAKIANGEMPFDATRIESEISQSINDATFSLSDAITLFIVLLIASAVVSYFVGKKIEEQNPQ
jgi:hypothetical protein